MLLRLRKVIGARDFAELMQQSHALREFEALCSVYGLPHVSSATTTTQQCASGQSACPNLTSSTTTTTSDAASDPNNNTSSRDDTASISDDDCMMMDIGTGSLYMAASAGAQRTWKVLPGDGGGGADGGRADDRIHNWQLRSRRRTGAEMPPVDTDSSTDVPNPNGRSSPAVATTFHARSASPAPAYQDVLETKQQHQNAAAVKKRRDNRHSNNYLFRPPSAIDPKVILETEISIADGRAVTMRILEGPAYDDDNFEDEADELVHNASNGNRRVVYEHSGLVRVLSDSDQDDSPVQRATKNSRVLDTAHLITDDNEAGIADDNDDDDYTTSLGRGLRSPRRVTFGGEIVKMRTPDSDSVATVLTTHSDTELEVAGGGNAVSATATTTAQKVSPSTSPRSRSRATAVRPVSVSAILLNSGAGVAGVCDGSLTSLAAHKQIEVLHNLQRSPQISPNRADGDGTTTTRRRSLSTAEATIAGAVVDGSKDGPDGMAPAIRNWEELGLVDDVHVQNLLSGVSCGRFFVVFCLCVSYRKEVSNQRRKNTSGQWLLRVGTEMSASVVTQSQYKYNANHPERIIPS